MKYIFLLSTITLFVFSSCKYQLDKENESTIKPPENTPPVEVSLSEVGDTIWVYQDIYLKLDINSKGKKIKNMRVILDTIEISNYTVDSYGVRNIRLYTEYDTSYFRTLTLYVETSSGTGSIAEQLEMEKFTTEKSWVVYVGKPKLAKPTTEITKDNFLKISWPQWNGPYFNSYELEIAYDYKINRINIFDIDSSFFIDTSYFGGTAKIRLNYTAKDGNSDFERTFWGENVVLEPNFPTLQFEKIGFDSLRIFWNKSRFNPIYSLRLDYRSNSLLEQSTDTSITIKHSGYFDLEYRNNYQLHCHSRDGENEELADDKEFNVSVPISDSEGAFAYNRTDKVLYMNKSQNIISSYALPAFSSLASTKVVNHDGLRISCPTNSSSVALLGKEQIYVYSNSTLTAPTVINYHTENNAIHFQMTDNGKIAIAHTDRYDLIDIETNDTVISLEIDDFPKYSAWSCMSTSKDGKYLCSVTKNRLSFYDLEKTSSPFIRIDEREYRSVLFNPSDPETFYLTLYTTSEIELRRANDFSLVKKIPVPTNGQVIRNIDPETGYMLTTDYKKLYIINIETNEVVFEFRGDDYEPLLYDKTVYGKNGDSVMLEKYLPKI